MARGSKSGGGGVIAVVVIGGLALLAAIPKEVWIGLGVLAVVGAGIYFYNKKSPVPPRREVVPPPFQPARTSTRTTGSRQSAPAATTQRWVEEPVSVPQATAQPSTYRVPPAPLEFVEANWIPAGKSVTVSGVTLPGGMLYVGTVLPTLQGHNDPALIDPTKSVAQQGDFTERQFSYWPSYSDIPASARRAYLNWLAQGKRDPEAEIGYVFLYFYGLERRAIIDANSNKEAEADWPVIAQELRRLLAIYGEKSNSFRRYAGDLLTLVELATYADKLYQNPIPHFERTWELPFHLRLALGQTALDGVPVPAHVALAWARLDPNISVRTPVTRCPEQFAKLFELKYAGAFGSGLALPQNKTKLKFVYRPASSGFQGYNEIKVAFQNTPDITVLTAPVKKLQEVVEAATKELEAYSRYVGRNPAGGASLDGLLQLPATLWPESAQKLMRDLQARMNKGMVVFTFQELLSMLEAKGTLTKDKVMGLARALESMNIAMEPDVLGGAKTPKPEDTVVLFSVQPGEAVSRSTPAYQAAVLTLQLASAVAMADGDMAAEEMRQLRTQIEGWTHLTPSHHQRLRAQLRLLIAAPVSLTVLKKKLEPLDVSSREAIARFMSVVAQSDGAVSPAELKMLEKVYKALGVEPKKVFSDVHAVATDAGAASAAGSTRPAKTAAASGFQLDPARIAALQQDTDKVSALLANIFKEDMPAPTPEVDVEPEEVEAPHGLLGLDESHTSFVRLLLSRPDWTREELIDVASDLDLMLDGALERINEASFDTHDMALTEGEDPIVVNREILEKVEA
jgi:tellurite resistance protein